MTFRGVISCLQRLSKEERSVGAAYNWSKCGGMTDARSVDLDSVSNQAAHYELASIFSPLLDYMNDDERLCNSDKFVNDTITFPKHPKTSMPRRSRTTLPCLSEQLNGFGCFNVNERRPSLRLKHFCL